MKHSRIYWEWKRRKYAVIMTDIKILFFGAVLPTAFLVAVLWGAK